MEENKHFVSIYSMIKRKSGKNEEFAAKVETDITNIKQVNHHINSLILSLNRALRRNKIYRFPNKLEIVVDDRTN